MQNKQEFLYKGPNHAANLNNMRLKDKYCDVTIKVDGKEIRAHKVILAANLKYFEIMFSSDFFQESQSSVITMESVEKANLELFVSYAYTGEILLTEGNALNLLELANYLSEDDIKEACIEFLKKHLKAEEACRAYIFANAIDCLLLKNAAKEKILKNFGDCSTNPDYLNFDSETLMHILSDEIAQSIQLQSTLFDGVMRWIMHDAKPRKICLEDLLNSIDITKLKSDGVMSCLYENVVHYNDEYGIIKDTIMYYNVKLIERKERVKVLITMDRNASYQFYNFTEKKWTSLLKVPGANGLIYFPSAVLNDQLYYISKISENIHLQVFDPSTKHITTLHSPSSILELATLCVCNGFLYIYGGVKQNHLRSDQVLRYDPQTNSFETLASMGTSRQEATGIFYQGYLYVLGGYDGSSYLQSVEKYDPVRNEWKPLASMCKKRCGHAVAELKGKLYACGGCSATGAESSVEVYDPATNRWQLIANMSKARVCFLGVIHEEKLLAIGGMNEKTVEVYDPSKDQWQMDDEMSLGLQLDSRVGGFVPATCITNTQ